MIPRLFSRCLLRPEDISPSQDDLEVIGAFNPGVAETSEGVTLLVRVAEKIREKRAGQVGLPRWDKTAGRVVADWVPENEISYVDSRVLICKATGMKRLTFISHIKAVRSRDGRSIDSIDSASLSPTNEDEEFGVEDPRITKLNGSHYITYVAVSRHGVATALASTTDFKTFERHGIIFPPENKDVVFFPEKIAGEYMALHRPNPAQHFSSPEMWVATSPDMIHWGGHDPFLGGSDAWSIGRVGAGIPPFRTEAGWVEIYHGNDWKPGDLSIGTYSAGALLLDLENPRRILGAQGCVLTPETDYERQGFVPNVIFPTGAVMQDDTMLVYYGAADQATGVLELRVRDLLESFR